jgi:hypothetical protein
MEMAITAATSDKVTAKSCGYITVFIYHFFKVLYHIQDNGISCEKVCELCSWYWSQDAETKENHG